MLAHADSVAHRFTLGEVAIGPTSISAFRRDEGLFTAMPQHPFHFSESEERANAAQNSNDQLHAQHHGVDLSCHDRVMGLSGVGRSVPPARWIGPTVIVGEPSPSTGRSTVASMKGWQKPFRTTTLNSPKSRLSP